MKKDRVIGGISILIGLIFTYLTSQIPDSTMVGDPGSRLFPYIACFLFLVCGVGLLLSPAKSRTEDGTFLLPKQWVRLGLMLFVMLLYYFLLDVIGFIPLSILLLFVMSTMFAENQGIAWWKRLIFSVVVTVLLYFAFTIILVVPLPMGIWG